MITKKYLDFKNSLNDKSQYQQLNENVNQAKEYLKSMYLGIKRSNSVTKKIP